MVLSRMRREVQDGKAWNHMPTASSTETFNQAREAWLNEWSSVRGLNQKLCTQIYLHFSREKFKETGELIAWPKWETLAQKTELVKSTVAEGMKRIEDYGALRIEHGRYNHITKKRDRNIYYGMTKVRTAGPCTDQGPESRTDQGPEGRTRLSDSRLLIKKGTRMKFSPSEGPLKTAEGVEVFIPPAPVKPGFDRAPITSSSYAESWGYIGRPSKVKYPLPEGWRPARALTSEEEQRLGDMHLWAKANGVMMADWSSYFEIWLKYPRKTNGPLPGTKAAMANALAKLDGFISQAGADGPRDGGQISPPIARRLPKPDGR
jgi:hypothetical protein